MSLVRWQNVLFLILTFGDIVLYAPKKKIPHALFHGIGFLFGFLPQMIVWKIVYGSFLLIPMGNETMHWVQPHILSVLFSARHGLFTWNPVFIISILGLCILYKKNKQITIYLLVTFLLQVYINAVPTNWWCGSSYGYRRLLDCLPIFILGLAIFINLFSQKVSIRIIYAIGLLFILWNVGLMSQFAFGIISHTEPVSFLEIFKNQFTQVPEKIGTILRYIVLRH